MAEKEPITNQVIEAIQKRRSVRSYKPDPIPRDILNTIIKAGNWAPTGGNRQPWRFVVVEDPAFRRKLQQKALSLNRKLRKGSPEAYKRWKKTEAGYEDPIYYSAPIILFVIGTGGGTEQLDCPMVCQNVMLAAYSLGIGGCWVGRGKRIFSTDAGERYVPRATDDPGIVKALELKEGERLYGAIVLGYPKVYPEPPLKKPPVAKWI